MAYLRLPFCSPYKVIWYLAKDGPAASDAIHHGFARYVWQMHGLEALPRIAVYSLTWPLTFALLSWKHTRRLGGKVQAVTGKSLVRQALEQFWIALWFSISPKKYYVFELFRPERYRNARHYIARYEFKGGLHNLLESRIENPTRRILNDKAAFFRHCEARGVATPPSFLLVRQDGRLEPLMPINGTLPKRNLFLKPLKGRGGRGCERWLYRDHDRYEDSNGNSLDEAGLVQHLRDLARKEDFIVQEALAPHGELHDLSLNVLTSCRIMSVKNERGGFEVTHAVFKSSTKPGAIVDNFHKGGIVSRVDIGTGELGPASDAGVGKPCVWYETHPLSGAAIAGRRLPLWQETMDLVRKAHAAFPDRITVGWDVSISDRGPIVLEGNVQSGCDMIQRTHDVPAGIGRLAECYAHHVREAFSRDVSMAWKARKGLA